MLTKCAFGNQEKNHHDVQLMVNGRNILRVNRCKYLGIIIDSNLSWKEHTDYSIPVFKNSLKNYLPTA